MDPTEHAAEAGSARAGGPAGPDVHLQLGNAALAKKDFPRAITRFKLALAAAEACGGKGRACIAHNQIAYAMNASRGSSQEILKHYEQALAIDEELGDKRGMATRLNNIGAVFERRGELDWALSYYHRALTIGQELGDRQGVSRCLSNIGVVYSDRGEPHGALTHYQQALKIARDLHDKHQMAVCLNNIGLVHKQQGEPGEALGYYREALAIDEEIGDQRGVAACLNHIGRAYLSRGEADLALSFYEQALSIDEELGSQRGVTRCLDNIRFLFDSRGRPDEALPYYERALVIAQKRSDPRTAAMRLYDIGTLRKQVGDLDGAAETLSRCRAVETSLRAPTGRTVRTLLNLARQCYNKGMEHYNRREHADALPLFERCAEINRETGGDAADAEAMIAKCHSSPTKRRWLW